MTIAFKDGISYDCKFIEFSGSLINIIGWDDEVNTEEIYEIEYISQS